MKHNVKFLIVGLLCLTVLVLMFSLCLNQPYLFTGFRITSSDFTVTELFDGGAASWAGLKVGDVITKINNIDTQEFASMYYGDKSSDWYSRYSDLFSRGELYRCELEDGSIHIMRVPGRLSFMEKLRFLSIDDKVCYGSGLLFILLGLLLSFISSESDGISSFIGFVYATGICITNAYSDSRNTLFYSVCNLTLFQLSTACLAGYILHIVGFFYRLSGREKAYPRFLIISHVPYFLSILRFVIVAVRPLSFFDSVLFYLPYLNIAVLGYAIIVLFILMHRIPPQSSLLLRFFLVGICFSLAPCMLMLFVRMISASLSIADSGESIVTVLPLLFLPVSIFCSFIQARHANFDTYASKIMVTGCAIISIVMFSLIPVQTPWFKVFLIVLSPFLCLLLERPVCEFLYPQIDFANGTFNDLEKLLFACDNEHDMYALVTDWLFSAMNPSFVVIYEMPDEEGMLKGKTLYEKCNDPAFAEDVIVSLIAERCSDQDKREEIVIHDNLGVSAPVFKAHHVFGYIFAGARSPYEMFSSSEIRLLQPTVRILMEALLVLDLKQQVEYINNMQNRIVYSFADMIESRDGTTGQHVKRTSLVVEMLTRYLKRTGIYSSVLKRTDYALISLAAPLHDIGKIKVPDRILSKPGKLTEEEFEIIKTHPVVGESIISKTMFKIEDERYLTIAREMALYHHEKWDGTGYPQGLKGKRIPISARIMAVADVFDALCSKRSYKEAYSIDKAFEIIDESSGTHFEPLLVQALHAMKDDLKRIYE